MMKFTIKSKALIPLSVILIVSCILLGSFSLNEISKLGEKLIGKQALSIVQALSYQIDGDKFEDLSKRQNEADPYLLKLNNLLQQVKDDTGCTYIYTMIKVDDRNYMYIATSDEESSLGDAEDVTDYDYTFKDSMNNGTSGYTKVEPDPEYGRMLSAVVPIKNSSGDVVGILACDFLANTINDQIDYARLPIIVSTIIIILLSCITIYIAINILFNLFEKITKATEKVSDSDLTFKINDNSNDEFGNLASNFNIMIEKLNYLIYGIRNISEIIDGNASRISTMSEEVYHSVNCTSEYINKITDITILIDSIEKKANLLSLSASTEAARAKDAGKVFSVVTDEMIKLSEMTTSSVNDIVKMINNVCSEISLVINNFKFLIKKIHEQNAISDDSIIPFEEIVNELEALVPQIKNIANKIILLNEYTYI